MKYAAIDIGTNTILLLISEKIGDTLRDIEDMSTIVRLGEGLIHSGALKEDAIARTIRGLRNYLEIADAHRVEKIFCVGTEALRKAGNARYFIDRVKDMFGLDIEIISGRDEAYYTYLSVSRDGAIEHKDMTIIDIGGGSTEIIAGTDKEFRGYVSLPLGSVVLTDSFVSHDPPEETELENTALFIRENLDGAGYRPASLLIGTGGTVTNIASLILKLSLYDKSVIHNYMIHIDDLKNLISSLASVKSADRKNFIGMEAGREDIIIQGATILRETMMHGAFQSCIASTAGVRYGLLYDKCGAV